VRACEAEKPIQYYVDRGAPEPMRTALLEGARWWDEAFEARDGRRGRSADLLPEDADPMDVRYNIIQWCTGTRGDGATEMRCRSADGRDYQGNVTLGRCVRGRIT